MNAPYSVRASRTVYESPWMRLREDAIVYADGREGIYGVLERPDFATVIALQDGHVQLVEQYRHAVAQRTLEFPHGAGNPDEQPRDVASRELLEETGLRAARLEPLGVLLHAAGHSPMRQHVFLATGLKQGDADPGPTEHDMRTVRLSLERFAALARSGAICESATLSAWALLELQHGSTLPTHARDRSKESA